MQKNFQIMLLTLFILLSSCSTSIDTKDLKAIWVGRIAGKTIVKLGVKIHWDGTIIGKFTNPITGKLELMDLQIYDMVAAKKAIYSIEIGDDDTIYYIGLGYEKNKLLLYQDTVSDYVEDIKFLGKTVELELR